MELYWGDMHAQFKPQWQPEGDWEQVLRRAFESARGHIDIFPLVYYPAFFYNTPEGLHVESVGMRPEFAEEWELVKRLVREYNAPGELISYPAYEWTGDRTRWGDCNVFFNEDDPPLDLSLEIDHLFANLNRHQAIAIPHHTGYLVGQRGKDWSHHNERLCPVTEIFSCHGSSEGCNTPFGMVSNAQMAPRVTGGTVQDALAQGIRTGIIASGDNGSGFPGRWGTGLMGLWAPELTRDAVWEALKARRTYGVTGDRIQLMFAINNTFMGDVLREPRHCLLRAKLDCTQALDRIEVIRDNRVVHTHCHSGTWTSPTNGTIRAKIPVEFGWGPTGFHGFRTGRAEWQGSLRVASGSIVSAEGCFTTHGNRIDRVSDGEMKFTITTQDRQGPAVTATSQQTIVFEVRSPVAEPITLEVDGKVMTFRLLEALKRSALIVFMNESRERVREQFGIDPDTVENPDVFYHNAHIVKRHMAIPEAGYRFEMEWEDPEGPRGKHFYYLRVSQLNGQMAWSSPVWVEGSQG